MKTIELIDRTYSGEFSRTRRACRGVVVRDGLVLLSHYPASGDLWMIPGGGKEEAESDRDTVIREVERKLNWWQRFRLGAFFWLLALAVVGWRREIWSLLKHFIKIA